MALIVIDAGLSTTVQDAGRQGYREWGVPIGGAFDRGSAELANALLGNPPGCAVLEFTLAGGTYQADCSLPLALAGAPMEARILGLNSTERLVRLPASFSLLEGERLSLGRNLGGARSYLAVKGGWQTKLQLGSRSTEQRLRSGDIIPAAGPGTVPARRLGEPAWKSPADEPFRIIAGPDARSHAEVDDAFWPVRRFRVGSQSDRMGLRLEGAPLAATSAPSRLSTPVAPGAIQVAGGQLIILGVACGTMGGYPHVAHVVSADLNRLGQLRSGDMLTFCPVPLEEARSLDRAALEAREGVLRRLGTVVEGV
jgi:5-oxoprolinase (ATP-hydrolysing) subunit C